MSDKIKDILIRALKTFWEAGLAYIVLNIQPITESISSMDKQAIVHALTAVGLGAISAAFSAVYNGVIRPFADKNKYMIAEAGKGEDEQ